MANLLIIDDSPQQRAALRTALEEAQLFDRVLEAEDGIRGLKLLMSEPVDLVICDLEMPGLEGDKLIRMSSAAQSREVPFLMLTAVADAKRRAKLFSQGARDVITKPFHPLDMIARIQLHLELMRLQDELLEKNRLLHQLSTTDPLTGLANRRRLDEALEVEFARARRHRQPLTVVMLDIDHFKQVNDSFGHAAGDDVIRGVGEVIRSQLRVSDVGGRYGGEEFLLLLGCPMEGAELFAERLRGSVEALRVETQGSEEISVTVSLGLASNDEALESPSALVAAADGALYEAKARGRNQVVSAPPADS